MLVMPGKFVLATPPKCGTVSFKSLTKWDDRIKFVKTMHRMDVPDEYADLTRIMVVRDPYARMVSMYHFAVRSKSEWIHRAPTETFDGWLQWMHEQRLIWLDHPDATTHKSPWYWLYNCSEMSDIFKPHIVYPLEKADELMQKLTRTYGVRPREEMYKSNTASSIHGGKGWKVAEYFNTPETLERMNHGWAMADCLAFPYTFHGGV